MSDEIRRSPVDDAQRLAEIRRRAWSKGWLPPTSTVAFLLDHIDALTARAEKAEAERDALRAILHADIDYHVIELRDDGWTVMHPFAERLKPETLFACSMRWEDGDIGVRGRYVLNEDGTLGAPFDLAPSPVEGGQ
jgi:hypothetical protein